MPIRGLPNGAAALVHAIHTPDAVLRNRWTPPSGMGGGRHVPESVVVMNRCAHHGAGYSANGCERIGMERAPSPNPTLEQLRRGTPWCWVVCERCLHRKPVAFVPLIIRLGA